MLQGRRLVGEGPRQIASGDQTAVAAARTLHRPRRPQVVTNGPRITRPVGDTTASGPSIADGIPPFPDGCYKFERAI